MQSNPIEQAALADVPASQDGKGLALRVQQVVKRYGGREVLHGIDLQAAPGEFLAIVGRSGCGKSTLLRLVGGLEDSDGGGVTLDGAPGNKQREALRVMFQDARLLPWKTVLDNVALGLPRARLADAARVLGQVGLAERAGEWPARLSGGQRQRVALARALVHHPRLLLLDEPLGALDALTRIEMQGLIEALWQRLGFTALLVTHDVSEAVALADRVVLIEDGRIALDQRVALPRPRQRGSAAFAQLEDAVLRRVMRLEGTPAADESRHGQALLPAVDWSVARTFDSVRWAI
ncbi:ATP-binding cassette domain-containing protein [Cupriavidus basilensis]|uniref:Alkanesulfonates ABC transporter ATP-binding protein n=1 Tax=Cupriavidus basilensis TaxID=68895 RepID=A0A0C4Y3P7_9BURK|nr:ATP-binding cassette domain-containing protein [Cupriavidus basilensis]AJG19877.1 Alkanesulfonates ABC transporter ATP-binding protein [Cupriavidus basilensis]